MSLPVCRGRGPVPGRFDLVDDFTSLMSSPTKSEFIRAKYQMLAFVHKLPCRDDDGATTKDLSKVRHPFPRHWDRFGPSRGPAGPVSPSLPWLSPTSIV